MGPELFVEFEKVSKRLEILYSNLRLLYNLRGAKLLKMLELYLRKSDYF